MIPNTYSKKIIALKRQKLLRFNDQRLHGKLPDDGGIYLIIRDCSSKKSALYVGKAKDLKQRLYNNLLNGQDRSHTLSRKLRKGLGLKDKAAVKRFLLSDCGVRWVNEPDAKERSYLEHFAIAHFRTPYND